MRWAWIDPGKTTASSNSKIRVGAHILVVEAEWIWFRIGFDWFVSGRSQHVPLVQLTVKRCDSPNKAIDSDHHGSCTHHFLFSGHKAFHYTRDSLQISVDYIESCFLVKVWDLCTSIYNIYIYTYTSGILLAGFGLSCTLIGTSSSPRAAMRFWVISASPRPGPWRAIDVWDLWQINMGYDPVVTLLTNSKVNLLDEIWISDLVVGANTYGKHQANDAGTIGHH